MKKTILTLLLALFVRVNYSQTNFSIDELDICTWYPKDNLVDNCVNLKEACKFTINSGETMITHVTPTMTSTYYVNEKRFFEETKTFVYDITSDVGNNYIMAIDFSKKQIRLFMDKGVGERFMQRYYIKASY